MTTEDHVMHLLEQARPAFDQQDLAPRVDASGYLDTLEQRSSSIMSEPDVSSHSPQRLWMGVAAAAIVIALVGALLLVNRGDESVPVDDPDPTIVPTEPEQTTTDETTPTSQEQTITSTFETPTTTTSTTTTTTTTATAPTTTVFTVPSGVPEIVEWRNDVFFQAISDGPALVDLERVLSTPQVLEATNQTGSSGAFSVRLLDADRNVIELVVDEDGARSGSYLVNLEQQGAAYVAVAADGDWSINLFDPSVNVDQWSGTEPLANAGPDVIRYTGDAMTVVFATGREEPFVISTYDATAGAETIAEGTGPAEIDLDIPAGPISIVLEVTGNWTLEPEPGG